MPDIKLNIIDRNSIENIFIIPSDCGLNLMELCKSAELGVEGICGGISLCGTCQIYINSTHQLSQLTEDEESMLDSLLHVQENSRLACQIKINESLDELIFTIAPNQ
ncbi:MAG: 2Fe-2S iron-sulfur cluster-binding protein [Saprospiraceae bacterium]